MIRYIVNILCYFDYDDGLQFVLMLLILLLIYYCIFLKFNFTLITQTNLLHNKIFTYNDCVECCVL